ncbi:GLYCOSYLTRANSFERASE [Salix viminalis]|uniref:GLYCOSYLTRANSFERASE n=1 Tax=Salix viminalis TaxID=40686 RepID=A0A9Q0TB25_SALVM|nr:GLYCOSYLTRANSFERASE [Salix viminalis]
MQRARNHDETNHQIGGTTCISPYLMLLMLSCFMYLVPFFLKLLHKDCSLARSLTLSFSLIRYTERPGAAMEEAIVLYPSPPIGHLISMVELGKLLLTHQPSLSVHILITSVPYDSGSTAPYIANVAATIPSIKFHHLPTVTLPSTKTNNYEQIIFDVLRLSNPLVREELLSISKNYTVHGLVVDVFCWAALSVAKELNIPGYHFSSSGAGILAVFFYFPTIHNTTTKSLKDLKTLLHIPGVPPIPSSDMPTPVLDRDDKSYDYFLDSSRSFPESAGIIINTFESLESRAVKTASEGLCVPNDRTPPIYCIGPLIATEGHKNDGGTRNGAALECLTWLDSQPVEEMKLALPMRESESGFVSAAEVEERVRGLMESEEGKLIRERTVGMKIAAKVASSEGGSSRVALSKLVESWKDK